VKWEKGEEGEKKRGRALPCLNYLRCFVDYNIPLPSGLVPFPSIGMHSGYTESRDDLILSPQTCKSNAYTLTPVYSRQQDTPKGGKQASLCRAVETQRPWPLRFLSYLLFIHRAVRDTTAATAMTIRDFENHTKY